MNKCIGVPNLSRDHWVQCGGWSASPNPENLYSLQTRIQQVNDAKGAREKVPIASRSHGWKKETETDPDLQILEMFAHLGNDLLTKPPRGIVYSQDIIGGLDFLGKSPAGEMLAVTYNKHLWWVKYQTPSTKANQRQHWKEDLAHHLQHHHHNPQQPGHVDHVGHVGLHSRGLSAIHQRVLISKVKMAVNKGSNQWKISWFSMSFSWGSPFFLCKSIDGWGTQPPLRSIERRSKNVLLSDNVV